MTIYVKGYSGHLSLNLKGFIRCSCLKDLIYGRVSFYNIILLYINMNMIYLKIKLKTVLYKTAKTANVLSYNLSFS